MEISAISHDLLKDLAEHSAAQPVVSIYLRTTSKPDEQNKNRIRLKNARRDALQQLIDAGIDENEAETILRPLDEPDSSLWSHRDRGVAIFIGGSKAVCVRLPNTVNDFVLAADHYHLKPLFAALPFEAPYFVLALSRNDVSLFVGDGTALTRIALGSNVPGSLADSAGHELSERQLQHHAGDRGSEEAIFHGQGGGKDDTDAEVAQFLRDVDNGLRTHYLDGSALILAGVSRLLDEFRKISAYPAIIDDEVSGNVEHMNVSELHAKAWPIIERRFRERRAAELEQLVDRATDRPVTTDLANTVIAAVDGRVERLFLAADTERWGEFDRDARQVITRAERRPTDNDLLDLAAANAFLAGAEVCPVPKTELPGDSDAIALLRY